MDHHRLRESSHGAHTQNFYQSCTISLFVCEIPLHTHTHTHSRNHDHRSFSSNLCPVLWKGACNHCCNHWLLLSARNNQEVLH